MKCGSCGKQIAECEMCGGLTCSPGCPDREEDGCTCDEEIEDSDDDLGIDDED